MPAPRFLSALSSTLLAALWTLASGSRGAWCRKQRRRLRTPGSSVVWVRGAAVAWAEWGARRGYFEVQYMDGLAYLRPLATSP
jgi:hypothetical protein